MTWNLIAFVEIGNLYGVLQKIKANGFALEAAFQKFCVNLLL